MPERDSAERRVNVYKLVPTSPGWLSILWLADSQHSPEVERALHELDGIPGVKLGPVAVEVPHTAWNIDVYRRLLDAIGVPNGVAQSVERPRVHHASLRPHQRAGSDWLATTRCGLLADDMGLGKTRTAVSAALEATGDGGTVVVVGPKFVREVWRKEIAAIASTDSFCALETRNLADGSFDPHADWYFVHYEIALYWATKLAIRRPRVCIIDEAHWAKNARTHRGEGAAAIAGICKYRFLLTGTPLENRPRDMWNLLTIACGARTWGSPLDFRKRYCGAQYNGFGWEDTDPTNVAELRQRLAPYYLRRTAEDAGLELPALQRQVHVCDIPESYAREARDILDVRTAGELVHAVASGVVQAVLPVLTRLRQLASRAKLQATVEFVNNCIDQGEHVVVFCWEREIASQLAARIGLALLVTGDHTQQERDQAVETFQTTDTPCAIVATYDSLREGVTLHRARIVVEHDLDWVFTHMLQAEKRIHRIGQFRACVSVWMVARDTADQLLAPVLEAKAVAMAQMLNDPAMASATAELQLSKATGIKTVEEQVDESLRLWEARNG